MSRSLGVADSKADIDEGTVTGLTQLKTATGSTIGFYGVTAIVQRTGATQGVVSMSAMAMLSASLLSAGGAWGFASSTQGNDAIAQIVHLQTRVSAQAVLVNELRASLVAIGAIAGA